MPARKRKKFNNFKKTIKGFIRDEDGFVSRKTILKIGLGTISALGIMSSLSNAVAGHSNHASHTNDASLVGPNRVGSTNCFRVNVYHSSHPSHGSHSSY